MSALQRKHPTIVCPLHMIIICSLHTSMHASLVWPGFISNKVKYIITVLQHYENVKTAYHQRKF